MKIAIISSRYPSYNKPYNHMFVHMRCLEMTAIGHKVTVFVAADKHKDYTYEGINVKMMPSKDLNKELQYHDILYLHLLNIYPYQKSNGWLIYKNIMENNLPFVMYVHGSEVQKYAARKFEFNYKPSDVLKWIKKDLFVIPKMKVFFSKTLTRKNADYVFPSLWMKKETERNLGLKLKEKFNIIPTGIEVDFFQYRNSTENRFKIITIRSLSNKVYDIEKTIEVMSYLPVHYTLDIYGEGIYSSYYLSLIKKKGLESRVRIIFGFVEKIKMKLMFTSYGIYISTTKMDSQGVNMMEAMAAGLLVATTDNSSKREFIAHLENGVLGTDAKSIADAILLATSNRNTFDKIAKKGREFIETISIKSTVSKELMLLNKIAAFHE